MVTIRHGMPRGILLILEYLAGDTEVQYGINLELADDTECTTILAIEIMLHERLTIMVNNIRRAPEHGTNVELEVHTSTTRNGTTDAKTNVGLEAIRLQCGFDVAIFGLKQIVAYFNTNRILLLISWYIC